MKVCTILCHRKFPLFQVGSRPTTRGSEYFNILLIQFSASASISGAQAVPLWKSVASYIRELLARSFVEDEQISQPALVVVHPAAVVSILEQATAEIYGDLTGHTGGIIGFMCRYGFTHCGIRGGAETFTATMLGARRGWLGSAAARLMWERTLTRGLFMPYDPLVSLGGWLVLRSADGVNTEGPFADVVEAAVAEAKTMVLSGRAPFFLYNTTHLPEGRAVMAFLSSSLVRVPLKTLLDENLTDGSLVLGDPVFILRRFVEEAVDTGAVPWSGSRDPGSRGPSEPRLPYDPRRAW